MQPGTSVSPQSDTDARRLAWRRSSLRSRRALVAVLCAVALATGIVGSNVYNRLQGADINDRSAIPDDAVSLSGSTSGVIQLTSPAATAQAAPSAPGAPLPPTVRPAPLEAALPMAPVVTMSPADSQSTPQAASAVMLATVSADTPAHNAHDSAARKRVTNGPRLRLDSTLHDIDWLPDATPQDGNADQQ